MRRFFLTVNFIFICFLCIAQQNFPGKIIGGIPDKNSSKLYQIQVGAFKVSQNTDNAFYRLVIGGLNPAREQYNKLTRVMLKGIPANEVRTYLTKIRQIGFNEVIIREDSAGMTLSEKWEINSPDSAYSSFEFNNDKNYIAVESNDKKLAHFGKYDMPQKDIINLENLGTVKISNDNETGISFSFSPINEPWNESNLTASKAETIPESPELDLFCRTWKVVDVSDKDNIGTIIFFSNAGTYFYTHPDGTSNMVSRWRWYDDKKEEFEYSHDDWAHYGRAKINELKKESLKYLDPGYNTLFPGYSNAAMDLHYDLVPLDK